MAPGEVFIVAYVVFSNNYSQMHSVKSITGTLDTVAIARRSACLNELQATEMLEILVVSCSFLSER